MYLAHFGLNQSPFGITPNPNFFFAGSKRGEILDALLYAVAHGEGIIKVTGEVGSGKTMLCRMLENQLPEHIEVLYLVNPTLTRDQVLYTIAGELNLITTGKRVDEVLRMLHNDLIAKHISGKQVVLLVEEAQAMPLQTLEEIRLFSNLETAHHKLMQIVLFGQPELDDHLNLPNMRQLKERITHSFKVPPLTSTDIPDYLMFRLRIAGYRGPDIFKNSAVKLIGAVSEGIVRRISILADKALLAAFADNSYAIESKHVKAAIEDSEFPKDVLRIQKRRNRAATVAALLLGAVGIAWFFSIIEPIGATAIIDSAAPTASAKASVALPRAVGAVASAESTDVSTPVATSISSSNTPDTSVVSAAKTQPTPAASEIDTSDQPLTKVGITSETKATTKIADTDQIADSTLEQRMESSKVWLNRQPQNSYSIQITLLSPGDRSEVNRVLRKMENETGLEEVHVYSVRHASSSRIGIVYGSYMTRIEALASLAQLSEKWGYRPQLRTIAGIKKEIAHAKDES